MRKVYLDYNATTPIAEEVAEKMKSVFGLSTGNPSSPHWAGRQSRALLNQARADIATCLNAESKNILFTSGGTESINLALKGAGYCKERSKRHVITTQVEHKTALSACQFLEQEGCELTYLPVDSNGNIDLKAYEDSFRPETFLVSVMYANNETGLIFPIKEIASIAKAKGALVHIDAVQAVGKLPLDWKDLAADFISISGHKIYGPKGIGILAWSKECELQPYLEGGGQESGFRAGTENVIGAVALAEALKLVTKERVEEVNKLLSLRAKLEESVLKISGSHLNAATANRLPSTCSFGFEGVRSSSLMMALDLNGIAVSAGSACASGSTKPSHVLSAMGQSSDKAASTIRVSIGRNTTEDEVHYFLEELPKVVEQIRSVNA